MPPELFHSDEGYRSAFSAGLGRLLGDDRLGSFVLVLANASYDPQIRETLDPAIRERFQVLAARLRDDLVRGRPHGQPADDLLVFLKLMAVGLDALEPVRQRRAGPWELQYNPLRSFRPARMSSGRVTGLHRPFDPAGFHFNRPFLEQETLWRGRLQGRECALFYNKFPFAPLHGLLVVEPARELPQFLDHGHHDYLWEATRALGAGMPGVGFGYNARGAFASVNQLHFQMFVRDAGRYPVESEQWRHNGGEADYPVPCRLFREPAAAWEAIGELHRREQPYNLLYRPGRLYLVPRAGQGSRPQAAWSGGFAWSEVAGAFTVSNVSDFHRLRAGEISRELARLAVAGA